MAVGFQSEELRPGNRCRQFVADLELKDTRAHWASDVLTGALLGYAVSSFLVDRYDDDSAASGDGATLSLSFSIKF